MLNKKTIIWMVCILLLISLAFGIEEAYPGLVVVPDYYGSGDLEPVLISEERASLPVLNNAEKFIFVSPEGWIEELKNYPPGGYKRKISKCVTDDGLSEDECLSNLVNDYFIKFNLNPEQQNYVLNLPEIEQKYLISTLGRSRGKKTFMAEWMKNHKMFNYITTHENTHTYTTHKIDLISQIELAEKKLLEANEASKDDIRKKLKSMRKEALFVSLWLEFVGDNKEVHFTNYGQVNRKEMFSEAFALIFNNLFSKKLQSFDMEKDYLIIEKYVAAHLLLDCFGMYGTFDESTGLGVSSAIDDWIESNEKTISIRQKIRPQIMAKVDSCPPAEPEPITYSGEAYSCAYEMKNDKMQMGACELVEVSEYEAVSGDSVWVGYDSDGVTSLGTFKSREIVINFDVPVSDISDFGGVVFSEQDIVYDVSVKEVLEGEVLITGEPTWVDFYSGSNDIIDEEPQLEKIKIIVPDKVEFEDEVYYDQFGYHGYEDEDFKRQMAGLWVDSEEAIEDQDGLIAILLNIALGEDVSSNVMNYWGKTHVWLGLVEEPRKEGTLILVETVPVEEPFKEGTLILVEPILAMNNKV